MVKIDNSNNQPPTNQTENHGSQNQTNPPNNQTPPKSGLLTIIGNLLPLAPFAFEQFTGQKVPQMTGTIAEMQMSLIQIGTSLQTIVQNQQTLNQRITNLENSAVQQLNNLTHQFNSLRLTHTQEKKQIEFNRPQPLEHNNENY